MTLAKIEFDPTFQLSYKHHHKGMEKGEGRCGHSPFPDDDTCMSVEMSDQSQSWLELSKIYYMLWVQVLPGASCFFPRKKSCLQM